MGKIMIERVTTKLRLYDVVTGEEFWTGGTSFTGPYQSLGYLTPLMTVPAAK